jgi:hypothetical protein
LLIVDCRLLNWCSNHRSMSNRQSAISNQQFDIHP